MAVLDDFLSFKFEEVIMDWLRTPGYENVWQIEQTVGKCWDVLRKEIGYGIALVLHTDQNKVPSDRVLPTHDLTVERDTSVREVVCESEITDILVPQSHVTSTLCPEAREPLFTTIDG